MKLKPLVLTSGAPAFSADVDLGLPTDSYIQLGLEICRHLEQFHIEEGKIVVLPRSDDMAKTLDAFRLTMVAQFNDNDMIIVILPPNAEPEDAFRITQLLGDGVRDRGIKNVHIVSFPHGTRLNSVAPDSVLGEVMNLNRQLWQQNREFAERCEKYEAQLRAATPRDTLN